MINIKTFIFLVFLMPLVGLSQENELNGFDHLINKTWIAVGEWPNGMNFKQEVSFSYDLNKTLVIANSKGYTNQEQTEYGNRNHGVRQYNASKNKVEFWEFDVFGGVTKGIVEFEAKDILYHYEYGESNFTDYWQYIDDKTYKFTVGNYKDGKWEAIYLQTEFKLKG